MQNTEGGFLGVVFAVVVIALAIWAATDDDPSTETYVDGERVGN